MKTNIFILMIFIIFLSCNKNDYSDNPDYKYVVPETFDDDLETASLGSVEMNEIQICNMMDYVNSISEHNIHNILIFRNNKLVFEEYFQGYALNYSSENLQGNWMQYTVETDHFIASITKSVTSVITGVAINQGYITDLNKKIIDYFPEYADILTGEKANITVKNVLTMQCGLEFDESTYLYNDSRSDTYQMLHSEDPIGFVLSKPLISSPGTEFYYNTGTPNILAAIIEKETGQTFFDYANINFFDAMNIKGGSWTMMQNGLPMASGGLHLRARELSKIGLMFLNGGKWLGKQFVSTDWISSSTFEQVSTGNTFFPNTHYGYQWWITNYTVNGKSSKCYFGAGWGDQYLFVIPDLELVVEFNSGNYASNAKVSPFYLLENYILKAIE
jgi:CubicO group peptidase (beta-lactamase class C family)